MLQFFIVILWIRLLKQVFLKTKIAILATQIKAVCVCVGVCFRGAGFLFRTDCASFCVSVSHSSVV